MICMYKSGKVVTYDTEVEYPRFRIPVMKPMKCEWIKSDGAMPFMKEPTFHHLEFQYITTVDDHRIYKEV